MPNSSLDTITSRHSAHFERLKSGESAKFDKFLLDIDAIIREQLSRIDLTEITRARLEQQILAIDALLNGTFDEYNKVWRESINSIASYEAGFEVRALGEFVGNVSFVLPSDAQLSAAVFSAPLASIKGPDAGSLLEPYYRNFSTTEKRRIEGAIRAGYAQGQTTAQVVKTIRGTKAAGYADGILAITARDARTMAHTALQHAAQQARQQVWADNQSVVKKWEFLATLDSRTSTLCRSLDGTQYPLDKGPKPPLHPGCRSSTVAVLDKKYDFLSEGATRSARDPKTGKVKSVDADLTYYDWLKKQPKAFQESILGPTRTKLLRDGGLSSERFAELNLNKNFTPATLAEMREMDSMAFDRAGL